MTPEQQAAIERLRELEAKATPGPWKFEYSNYQQISGDYASPSWIKIDNKEFLEENGKYYGNEICFFNQDLFQSDYDDGDLLVALRNDGLPLIEALAAENERLTQALADLRDEKNQQISEYKGDWQMFAQKASAANQRANALQATIDGALGELANDWHSVRVVVRAVEILKGEGEQSGVN
jgi:hypothetical protein